MLRMYEVIIQNAELRTLMLQFMISEEHTNKQRTHIYTNINIYIYIYIYIHINRSERFPRAGYFIPGRDGTGARHISRVVRVSAHALFGELLRVV